MNRHLYFLTFLVSLGVYFSSSYLSAQDLAIAVTDADKAEGNAGNIAFTFTVTRTAPLTGTSSATWTVTGNGADPATADDFAGGVFPTGTVNFAATENTQVITVNVSGDTAFEPNQGFTVTLSASVDATITTATANGTIQNDDALPTLAITATDADKAEGNAGDTPFTFTVSRSGDLTGASSATYTVTGSGSNAADFQGGTLPIGTVTFAANETTQVITINVLGDAIVEPNEGFTVTLSAAMGATITTAAANGVIQNDDSFPTLAIAATDANKPEGNAGNTPFTFTVTRTGNLAGASTVSWIVTGSGAIQANAGDFAGGPLPSGILNFSTGVAIQVITINVSGDMTVESNEGFTVTLFNSVDATITTATAVGNIQNDDSFPIISIAVNSANKPEGNGGNTPFTFTVSRTGNLSLVSSIDWAVSGSGTNPANNADINGNNLPSGTLNFIANDNEEGITIQVIGDLNIEPDETFIITLSNPTNATIGTGTATGTIQNDDSAPEVFLVAEGVAVTNDDGNPSTFGSLQVPPGNSVTFVALPLPSSNRIYYFYVNNTLRTFTLNNSFEYIPSLGDEIRVTLFDFTVDNNPNPNDTTFVEYGRTDIIRIASVFCEDDPASAIQIPQGIINITSIDPWYKVIGIRYKNSGNFLQPVTAYTIGDPLPVGVDVAINLYNSAFTYNMPQNLLPCYGSAMQRDSPGAAIDFDPNNPIGTYNPTVNSNAITFNPCDGFLFDPSVSGIGDIVLEIIVEDVISGNQNSDFVWSTIIITVNPKPTPIILGNPALCADNSIAIYSTPLTSGGFYNWQIDPVNAGTITNGQGTNQATINWINNGTIRLTETSAVGCEQETTLAVVINPIPTPTIANQNLVVCKPIAPTNYAYTVDNIVVGHQYSWRVTGGNFTSSNNLSTVTIDWGNSTSGTVEVTERNPATGCVTTVTKNVSIAPLPIAKFTFESTCDANNLLTVRFDGNSSTVVSPSNVVNWQWSFTGGTGTITPINVNESVVDITFDDSGSKTVELTVTTDQGCTNTTNLIFVLGPDGWIATGENNSWNFQNPVGSIIQFTNPLWITSNTENTYNNSEQSFVESPCFDLESTDLPMVNVDIWTDTDIASDGAILLYRLDKPEAVWKVLGQVGGGDNWYNRENILGTPGTNSTNLLRVGWAGQREGFLTAKYSLDDVKVAVDNDPVATGVRFRVAFGSNTDNPIGVNLDGFAFKEFKVVERDRLVIVEHFTNTQLANTDTSEDDLNNILNVINNQKTLVLRYLTSFPINDPNITTLINKADNSARALYYGIAELTRTVIDGIFPFQKNPINFNATYWDDLELEHSRRILNQPSINISVPVLSQENGQSALGIQFDLTQTSGALPVPNPFLVQICLVEKQVAGFPNYLNIVRGFAPNLSGATRLTWDDLNAGFPINLTWEPPQDITPNDFKIVVFIQDEVTKEIYQAQEANIPFLVDAPGGRENQADVGSTNPALSEFDFTVYPNPSNSDCNIWFSTPQEKAQEWILRDNYGKVIATGEAPAETQLMKLRVSDFASGLYTLQIGKVMKKIVVE
jgi:hypothetical protein